MLLRLSPLFSRRIARCCYVSPNCVNVFAVQLRKTPSDDSGVRNKISKIVQKHAVPSDSEAAALRKQFPNPKDLVDSLYHPFSVSGEERWRVPTLHSTRHFEGQLHRSTLQIEWPQLSRITGAHEDPTVSIENAYLLACVILKEVGFLRRSGREFRAIRSEDAIDTMTELISQQGSEIHKSNGFEIIHALEKKSQKLKWHTTISMSWPVIIDVSSSADDIELSHYKACLVAIMRLKGRNLLTEENMLAKGFMKQVHVPSYLSALNRDDFLPDFTIFSDASAVGYGAYLVSKDSSIVSWISDPWKEQHKTESGWSIPRNTDLAEFYALVSACYTWRNQCREKNVLLFSDNKHTVNLVNSGMFKVNKRNKWVKTPYSSLFSVLCDTCSGNYITVRAQHVNRSNNMAADMLSKGNRSGFMNRFPQARPKADATKILPFSPITDDPPFTKND